MGGVRWEIKLPADQTRGQGVATSGIASHRSLAEHDVHLSLGKLSARNVGSKHAR